MPQVSESVLAFLEHFTVPRGTFQLHVPGETPYEEMVRKYEANDPHTLHVMKIILDLPIAASTAKKELALWKKRAADERKALRNTVHVRHAITLGGSRKLQAFEELIGNTSREMIDLYRRVRSAELYVDESSAGNGFTIFPVSAMAGELQHVLDWFDEDENDYEESNLNGELELFGVPPWIQQTVVFAGASQSAERFLLACTGPHKGSVFEFDHDMLGFRRKATSLSQFLDLLRCAPLTVAKWVGIHEAEVYEHAA